MSAAKLFRLGSRKHRRAGQALILVFVLVSAFIGWQLRNASAEIVPAPGGIFEMDGSIDAPNNTDATIPTTPPYDWSSLFDANGNKFAHPGTNSGTGTFTGLLADSFFNDNAPDPQYIGGGSKDQNDVNQWQCTTKGSAPKDEIANSYVALFQAITSVQGGPQSGDLMLELGLERPSVNGSANSGFWLLQDPNATCPAGANQTANFGGGHVANDLFILAGFSNGGTTPTLDAATWPSGQASGAKNVTLTDAASSSVLCNAPGGVTTTFCGMVNSTNVVTPWAPNNTAANPIAANGFYEVAIDLTQTYANLPGSPKVPCFSNYAADTRASPVISSELHDFIGGGFNSCVANVSTTPSSTALQLGSTLTDTATVTGPPGFTPPTGTVTFYECGPLQSAPTTNGPNCTTASGTKLTNATHTDGKIPIDTTTQQATSPSFKPPSAGTYCFLAVYSGDSNYGPESDSLGNECFTVYNSTTSTTPSSTAITLGASVTDTATITPLPAGGPAPTGTVTFYVCSLNTTPTAAGPNCSTSGTKLTDAQHTTGAVTIANTAAAGATPVYQATSPLFKPPSAGTYCFDGEYSGDTTYPGSNDSSSGECFTATAAPANLTSTVSLDDTVKIADNATAGMPTGDVTFKVYGPFTSAPTASCTGTPLNGNGNGTTVTYTSEGFDSNSNGYWTANVDVPATLGNNSSPVWYAWSASFTSANTGGNKNYASGSLGCTSEIVQLTYGTNSGFALPASTTDYLGNSNNINP